MQVNIVPGRPACQEKISQSGKNPPAKVFDRLGRPEIMRRRAAGCYLQKWLENVSNDETLPENAYRVATYLANYLALTSADDWPSTSQLGEELGYADRTIRRSLAALRDRGYLTFGGGRANDDR